jgi:hypothetical protein
MLFNFIIQHNRIVHRDFISHLAEIYKKHSYIVLVVILVFPAALIMLPAFIFNISKSPPLLNTETIIGLCLLSAVSATFNKLFFEFSKLHFVDSSARTFPLTQFHWFVISLIHLMRLHFIELVSVLVALGWHLMNVESKHTIAPFCVLLGYCSCLLFISLNYIKNNNGFFVHALTLFSAFLMVFSGNFLGAVLVVLIDLFSKRYANQILAKSATSYMLAIAVKTQILFLSFWLCVIVCFVYASSANEKLWWLDAMIFLFVMCLSISISKLVEIYQNNKNLYCVFPYGRKAFLHRCKPSIAMLVILCVLAFTLQLCLGTEAVPMLLSAFSLLAGTILSFVNKKLVVLSQVCMFLIYIMSFYV